MSAEPIDDGPVVTAHDPWSEAAYLALPEKDGPRVELIDGGYLMTPVGDGRHQNLGFRLGRELDRVIPDDFEVFHEANVRLGPKRIIIPDVVVSRDRTEPLVHAAGDVVLVGEVVSPSSLVVDRVLKPAMCAEAGIPWYLRVERQPELELVLHRLDSRPDGEAAYVVHARARAGEQLELPKLECTIDVDALLRRRG